MELTHKHAEAVRRESHMQVPVTRRRPTWHQLSLHSLMELFWNVKISGQTPGNFLINPKKKKKVSASLVPNLRVVHLDSHGFSTFQSSVQHFISSLQVSKSFQNASTWQSPWASYTLQASICLHYVLWSIHHGQCSQVTVGHAKQCHSNNGYRILVEDHRQVITWADITQ